MSNQILADKTEGCYVCGLENPVGLHVRFSPQGDAGSCAHYVAHPDHGGWPGILHGGVTFSLMDEALGWALYFRGISGVTAKITARYRLRIPIGTRVHIAAWIVRRRRHLIHARAVIRLGTEDGRIAAEAEATMIVVSEKSVINDKPAVNPLTYSEPSIA